jgi:hypothetical protein
MLADPRRPYHANRPLSAVDDILRYHYTTDTPYCPKCQSEPPHLWGLENQILYSYEGEIYALDLDRLKVEGSIVWFPDLREYGNEFTCYEAYDAWSGEKIPHKIAQYIDADLSEYHEETTSEEEALEMLKAYLLREPQPIQIPSSRIEAFCKAQREQNAKGEALAQENLKYIIENTGDNQ